MEQQIKQAFAAGELDGLHSVLVMRERKILAESHFKGEDESWGTPLGERTHSGDTLHDVRSVTKSIVGLLYGIALADGLVPGLDESLTAQFPDYTDLASDPDRQSIRIRHALTMQMGTEWDETLPYSDPRNSEIAMEHAEDRIRFVLDRPILEAPGTSWVYNGGATAVIARLIAEGTGVSIDAYAKEKLFDPLGIETFEWTRGFDGTPSAASGLRLNIHDLAKIGQLMLENGVWNGEQIVPSRWIDDLRFPHAVTSEGPRYGFFWWVAPDGDPPYWYAGFGNGGQRLMVNPFHRLVFVVFAGNYNQQDAWQLPVKIFTEVVLPAVQSD